MSKETVKTPVRLQIVNSYWQPGALSVRTVDGRHADSIKEQLKEAGYEVGDIVELVVVGKVDKPYKETK